MNHQLHLSLSLEEVNQILACLGQEPYKQVFTLIHKIQEQARSQLQQEAEAEKPGLSPQQGNAQDV